MNKIIEYKQSKYIYIGHSLNEMVKDSWLYNYEEEIAPVPTEWVGKTAKDCVGAAEHFLKPYSALREDIERHSKEELVELYERSLEDWADDDTRCRNLCKDVLTEWELEGDSYCAHFAPQWIEYLIEKLKKCTD